MVLASLKIFDSPKAKRMMVIAFLLMMVVFLLFININMPLVGEDYTLQAWGYTTPPTTFTGKILTILKKLYGSATQWSPRIGEALSTIMGVFPPLIFDILNSLFFIWLIFILFIISYGRFPSLMNIVDDFSLFSIFFLIILLMPLLGQIFFWKSGTTNHVWGLIFLLSFIIPFRMNYSKRIHIKSTYLLILYTVLGFFAGLSIENACAVVLGILIIYYIVSLVYKKIDFNFVFPLTSFTIGVFILLFSPSTAIRRNFYSSLGSDGNLFGLHLYLNRLIRINRDFFMISRPLLIVFIACLLVYLMVMQWKHIRIPIRRLNNNSTNLSLLEITVLFFLSFSSVLILSTIAYQSDQRRGFAFFWLVLVSLIAYLATEIWKNLQDSWRLAVVSLSLVILFMQMFNMGVVYTHFTHENNIRMGIIYSSLKIGEKEITLPAIATKDSRIIETREILPDLGVRIATYYGFDSVEIDK